jgi:DNA-binding GntR family transcriptional regulator
MQYRAIKAAHVTSNQQYGAPAPIIEGDPRKYRQIYAAILARVDSGEIKQGQALPSIAELASRHGVARQTAAKALKALVSEGIATCYPGFGYYLAMPRPHAVERGFLLPDARDE